MTATSVDAATGCLLVGGKRVFPIGLSDPPPLGSTAPDSGLDAWAEIARAGVTFVRNYTVWTAAGVDEQLVAVAQLLDAAPQHGLQLWLALAGVDNDLSRQALLDRVVNTFKGHPGLGAWKGSDEPAHAPRARRRLRGRLPAPARARSGPSGGADRGAARARAASGRTATRG